MPRLSQALLLNQYILHQFGVKDLAALSENLRDAAHGLAIIRWTKT